MNAAEVMVAQVVNSISKSAQILLNFRLLFPAKVIVTEFKTPPK